MSKKAFIFPGQGSQYAGMGKELADNFKVAAHVFQEADDALGFKLSTLCFDGPEEDLKLTANTQPAILSVSIAALRVLQAETSLTADYLAGHSLGEYSALVASGAMQFADAVRTVRARGTFMQEAVPVGVGSMAAILGVEPDVLQEICAEAAQGEVVSPANFNSPGQIVIAGHAGAVNRAIEIAKGRGFRKAMLSTRNDPALFSDISAELVKDVENKTRLARANGFSAIVLADDIAGRDIINRRVRSGEVEYIPSGITHVLTNTSNNLSSVSLGGNSAGATLRVSEPRNLGATADVFFGGQMVPLWLFPPFLAAIANSARELNHGFGFASITCTQPSGCSRMSMRP